jgi:HAD superfamily hydrolase (TIGR01509 family)
MIRALLFDFDGLILDTEVPDYECWQEVFQAHGCELSLSLWVSFIGTTSIPFNPYDHLEELAQRPILRDQISVERKRRYLERVEALSPLPGVEDYLRDARRLGLKVGLVTSSTPGWAVGHLARLGLDAHFDLVLCAADVQRTKPDPELYLLALERLGLQAEEALALEDSPNGVAAAKAAGIYCVAVPNPLTRDLDLRHADLRLDALNELPLEELLQHANKRRECRT